MRKTAFKCDIITTFKTKIAIKQSKSVNFHY